MFCQKGPLSGLSCWRVASRRKWTRCGTTEPGLNIGILASSTAVFCWYLVCYSHVHSSCHSGTPPQRLCFPWTCFMFVGLYAQTPILIMDLGWKGVWSSFDSTPGILWCIRRLSSWTEDRLVAIIYLWKMYSKRFLTASKIYSVISNCKLPSLNIRII